MALRLGVRLRKPGVYALNAGALSPGAEDVQRALTHAGRAAMVSVALATLVWLVRAA
jgi:adenosylcobinamide-phosphate synthase